MARLIRVTSADEQTKGRAFWVNPSHIISIEDHKSGAGSFVVVAGGLKGGVTTFHVKETAVVIADIVNDEVLAVVTYEGRE